MQLINSCRDERASRRLANTSGRRAADDVVRSPAPCVSEGTQNSERITEAHDGHSTSILRTPRPMQVPFRSKSMGALRSSGVREDATDFGEADRDPERRPSSPMPAAVNRRSTLAFGVTKSTQTPEQCTQVHDGRSTTDLAPRSQIEGSSHTIESDLNDPDHLQGRLDTLASEIRTLQKKLENLWGTFRSESDGIIAKRQNIDILQTSSSTMALPVPPVYPLHQSSPAWGQHPVAHDSNFPSTIQTFQFGSRAFENQAWSLGLGQSGGRDLPWSAHQ